MYGSSFEAVNQTRRMNADLSYWLAPDHYGWPDVLVGAVGFDIDAHFDTLQGPAIEVGGPSGRYNVLQGTEPPADTFITNIQQPRHGYGPYGHLDARLDASRMPFQDGSVGSLFTSYLPMNGYDEGGQQYDLRQAFMNEARRCLEPDGLLVMQGSSEADVQYALELGFTPARILQSQDYLPMTGMGELWDCVLLNTAVDPGFTYEGTAIGVPTVPVSPALAAPSIETPSFSAPGMAAPAISAPVIAAPVSLPMPSVSICE